MANTGFYERVLVLCREKGVSPSSLASSIGRGSATATGWKTGAIPRADTLKKIADFFNVTPDFLLSGDEGPDELVYISPNEAELLRLFRNMGVKDQTELLSRAYALEGQPYQIAARGGASILKVTDEKEKAAIDDLFDSVDGGVDER